MSGLQRREFIGSLLGFASVSGIAGPAALANAQGLPMVAGDKTLVLYRAGQGDSAAFAAAWAAVGHATLALDQDVVRQWRDGLGDKFEAGKRLLVGLGSWDDQVLLQGLAAEARRHPLLVMQHPLQSQQAGWAAAHAQELQVLLTQASGEQQEQALQALARRGNLQPTTPSLFSWVLG
jgi:hypothetical protein